MAELKPCPFCGEEAELFCMKQEKRKVLGVYYKIATIRCTGLCTAQVSQAGCNEKKAYENAANMWNRRSENEELKFTRQFIHEHGLDFALASAWDKEKKDGK